MITEYSMKYHSSSCFDKIYLKFVYLQKFYVQHFRILKMASQHMPLCQLQERLVFLYIVLFILHALGDFVYPRTWFLRVYTTEVGLNLPLSVYVRIVLYTFYPFFNSTFSHSRWNSSRNKKMKVCIYNIINPINKSLILDFEITLIEHSILLIWKIWYILIYTCTTIYTCLYGLHFFVVALFI